MLVATIALLTGAACTSVSSDSAVSGTSAAGELTPITLGVGFVPNVQFAPFYVGIEKGFYEDGGLDVDLEYGYENDYLKLVGMGQTHFMVGSGDQVVLGQAQGLPVRYVMKWFTKYPVVIASLKGSGIVTPEDLAGTTVGIPGPFGASYVAYRGILEAAGLGEEDLTMESIGFTQAAALSQGAVDAAVVYAANTPVVLDAEGIATDIITLDDYLQIPANGLVTNNDTIEHNPEIVSAMVGTTAKAIEYTLEHPDEAFEIALKHVPEAGGDSEPINRAVFDASLEYWTPSDDASIGESTQAEWSAVAEFMQRVGLADVLVEAEGLFTNEFLP